MKPARPTRFASQWSTPQNAHTQTHCHTGGTDALQTYKNTITDIFIHNSDTQKCKADISLCPYVPCSIVNYTFVCPTQELKLITFVIF